MSEVGGQDRFNAEGLTRLLRVVLYAAVAAQVLLYLYLYVYIGRHANPKGDGMEWVAVMPATFVLGVGILPALLLSARQRWLPIAVFAAVAGVILKYCVLLRNCPRNERRLTIFPQDIRTVWWQNAPQRFLNIGRLWTRCR